jgi:hydroxysqualene dehydroxylase
MATAHIVGAGLAGLSAAVRLAERGWAVRLHEAAPQAGGRCRSYFDDALGCRIDNGNHLLLSGNRSAMAYLAAIGAADTLAGPARAEIPFVDLADGRRWTVRPNAGPVPWWPFAHHRRAPGTGAADYLAGLRLRRAGDATVSALFADRPAGFRAFWEPLAVAVLNTEPEAAAARLLWPVMTEILARGEAASRPRVAAIGLSESFVDPALAHLAARGGSIGYGRRLRALGIEGGRVAALEFADRIDLAPGDAVVLAVPPWIAAELLPGLVVPGEFRPIVNAHFRLDRPATLPGGHVLLGVLGAATQWIFARGDVLSVTISAATHHVDAPAETLAPLLWREVCAAAGLADAGGAPPPLPRWRIVKEKRATMAQTPAQLARRPQARTALANLALAGDWTDTGLPATIEGAIRSGEMAPAVLGGG